MFRLPGGEGPLAFLAVETFQNGRVEAPGQTLDDLIRIDRSIDDFFLFVQVHLLFRSTAWSMGVIGLQSPMCGIREAGPALLQSWPPNFFCAEYRNTRPSRPPAPNAPSRAGSWAGGAVFEKNEAKEIKRQYDLFFADVGERARGAGNFHFPPQFYSRAQSGRTYTPR